MTPTAFAAALQTLGWTIRGLARILGRPEGTVTNWTREKYRVPDDVAAWLQRRVAAHEAMMRDDPPPTSAPAPASAPPQR